MISTLTATVTGADVTLALTAANGYEINAEGFGPGGRSYRRETTTSPFVRGRFLIARQLDTAIATMSVFVQGTTASQFATRVTNLLAAFDQFSYTLDLAIDGQTYQWLCEPADVMPGAEGVFDFWDLGAFGQVFHLSIPRDPIAVTGAL